MKYRAKVLGPNSESAYSRAWAIVEAIQPALPDAWVTVRSDGEYDGYGLPCVFDVPQALTECHPAISYIRNHA